MRELSEWEKNMSDDTRRLNAHLLEQATKQKRTAAGKTMGSEEAEQIALFAMADSHIHEYPELALMFHVPNGGDRHPAVAAKLKAAGVKRGVPDVWLPVPRGGYHGLVLEIKVGNNKLTENQIWWIKALQEQGYAATMVLGADQAWLEIVWYLESAK